MSNDLTAWLREQIDEDERAAREVSQMLPAPWVTGDRGATAANGEPLADGDYGYGGSIDESASRHIVRHDPARALREVEANRLIIDEHVPTGSWPPGRELCVTCDTIPGGRVPWPCRTLRLLALPYADRPGYREEWRP